jgi:hypothetical protein
MVVLYYIKNQHYVEKDKKYKKNQCNVGTHAYDDDNYKEIVLSWAGSE